MPTLLNRRKRAVVCLVALHLLVAGAAPAATYHVKTPASGGNNGNDGLSPATPFATISKAASLAQAGDTVLVYSGVYPETVTPANSGHEGAWIEFRAAEGETPIIDGGFTRSLGFNWTRRTHLLIEGFTIRHCTDIGVGNQRPGKVIVRRVIAHANGSAGIAMNYSGAGAEHGVPSQVTVEDCITYENGWGIGWASGIHINNKGEGAGTHHIIRRNISFNNYDGSDYHTDGNGIMFDIAGAGGYALIENNVCFNNGARGINVMWGRADVLNNICFRNGWDTASSSKAGELTINGVVTPDSIPNWQQAQAETSQGIVRNNILWMRPLRNDRGHAFEAWGIDEDVFTVDNNLIWADIPAEAPSSVYPYMTNTIIEDPRPTSAPLDDAIEPYLGGLRIVMNAAAYDFRPLCSSPAIDAALAAATNDLLHRPRPFGAAPDLGPYEMRYIFGPVQQLELASIGAEDGRTWGNSTGEGFVSGSPTGADLRVGDTADLPYRSILSFDTAALPAAASARIASARLRLTRAATSGTNPFTWGNGLRIDMAAGAFGAAALEASDFQAAATHGAVATITADPGADAWVLSTDFAAAATRALVPRSRTQFRLQFATPALVNGFAWDWASLYSGEATNPAQRPTLVVEWQPLVGEAPLTVDAWSIY